jgi:uncharacterized damage-inducible protein DinB
VSNEFTLHVGTLCELFTFNDWARDAIMKSASQLSPEQLDRKFEIGWGSLRNTLNHLCAVEGVWLDRWQGKRPQYRLSGDGIEMGPMWEEWHDTAKRRSDFLDGLRDANLAKNITYMNIKGETLTFPIGAMMLHVCNHGSYHRAQALNMLRHVGAVLPKPQTDYIFMKLHDPEGTPCQLDLDTIQSYLRYSDWAQERMLRGAEALTDAQLDRKFEMGVGSLRQTLAHLRDAEAWWLSNWTSGAGALFPENPSRESIDEISSSFRATCGRREKFLEPISDADLMRHIDATPRPGMIRTFRLGVTLLQICHHGTHHRAQAINMLRHVGGEVIPLDLLEMLKN